MYIVNKITMIHKKRNISGKGNKNEETGNNINYGGYHSSLYNWSGSVYSNTTTIQDNKYDRNNTRSTRYKCKCTK